MKLADDEEECKEVESPSVVEFSAAYELSRLHPVAS